MKFLAFASIACLAHFALFVSASPVALPASGMTKVDKRWDSTDVSVDTNVDVDVHVSNLIADVSISVDALVTLTNQFSSFDFLDGGATSIIVAGVQQLHVDLEATISSINSCAKGIKGVQISVEQYTELSVDISTIHSGAMFSSSNWGMIKTAIQAYAQVDVTVDVLTSLGEALINLQANLYISADITSNGSSVDIDSTIDATVEIINKGILTLKQ